MSHRTLIAAEPEYLSMHAAGEKFDCSHKTIRRMIARGYIQGYRLPGSRMIRVNAAELEAALQVIPAIEREN